MKLITFLILSVCCSISEAAQWTVSKNGPGNGPDEITSMKVAGGYVYVTGSSYSSNSGLDYLTIKYNSSGVQQWLMRYNGTGNGDDIPRSIYVDAAGYIYVTGSSVRVAGATFDTDATTIKYSPSGSQIWVRRYDGVLHRKDQGNSVKTDANGNVYITGFTTVANLGYSAADYLTIKYNASGTQQWVRTHNGPGNGGDVAIELAINGSNIYITGTDFAGRDPRGEGDYLTIKYNASGTELWQARYNGPISESDGVTGLVVDGAGNCYVTGSSRSGGINTDFATVKYNSSGVQQWVRRYGAAAGQGDIPSDIEVDNSGNVYVTGTDQTSAYNYDYRTLKYNASGTLLWSKKYDGPYSDNDYANAIYIDGSGNVYITGQSKGTSWTWDIASVKYSASGSQLWVRRYNGPGNDFDSGNEIATDGSGNVYVAGTSTGINTNLDFTTIKYNASGIREVEEEVIQKFALNQNYPNPFTTESKVVYQVPENSEVTFNIINIEGKVVQNFDAIHNDAGEYTVDISANNLQPGIYILTMETADIRKTIRMVVEK